MASKNITDWTTPVEYYVKGISNTEVTEAGRHILRDFCERTAVWTYDVAAISTVANTPEYAFADVDSDGANVVCHIVAGRYKEDGAANSQFYDLEVTDFEKMEKDKQASWQYETTTNPSHIMFNFIDNKFRLYPIPDTASASGLIVNVAVKPDMAATKVPIFIWNNWSDTITKGIAGHLMGMTNKPWANKHMSKVYLEEYRALRHNAAMEKKLGKTPRKLYVKPRKPFLPGSKNRLVYERW